MAYSLLLSCCCYTCCIRRKLRKMLNITVMIPFFCINMDNSYSYQTLLRFEYSLVLYWDLLLHFLVSLNVPLLFDILCQGGFVDDFLSHLMCCCCALVQEWREVEIRRVCGINLSAFTSYMKMKLHQNIEKFRPTLLCLQISILCFQ